MKKILLSLLSAVFGIAFYADAQSVVRPQEALLFLDHVDAQLGDPITYYQGLENLYLVVHEDSLYNNPLLRERTIQSLRRAHSGLASALLPEYNFYALDLFSNAYNFWPSGIEKLQIYRWAEHIQAKVNKHNLVKKDKGNDVVGSKQSDYKIQKDLPAVKSSSVGGFVVLQPVNNGGDEKNQQDKAKTSRIAKEPRSKAEKKPKQVKPKKEKKAAKPKVIKEKKQTSDSQSKARKPRAKKAEENKEKGRIVWYGAADGFSVGFPLGAPDAPALEQIRSPNLGR